MLAILEALPKEDEKLVVGRKYSLEGEKAISLENKVITHKKIPFEAITTGRLQRKLTKHTLFSLFKFPYGLVQSFLILKRFKPDIILSFGGYISFPVVLAGFLLRVPIVIHEQTLEAGFANRVASIFASKVCISWESSARFFPKKKTELTGNPVKASVIKNAQEKKEAISVENNLPLVYITGGSLGSHAINLLVEGCVKNLLEKYNIFHQTGDSLEFQDFDRLEKLKYSFDHRLKQRYILEKFVDPDHVSKLMKKADLIVSRSGMNTICELILLKKPSLLIPLFYSQKGEQKKNALLLKKLGIGEIYDQNKITSVSLYEAIESMMNNLEVYQKNGEKIRGIIKTDAAFKIIEVLRNEIKAKQ